MLTSAPIEAQKHDPLCRRMRCTTVVLKRGAVIAAE
jgi:hypothetical protein